MTTTFNHAQTLNSPNDLVSLVNTLLTHQPLPGNIALCGPLGTGKTTFVQQLGQILGCTQSIVSPTFTLLNEYSLPNGQWLIHADVYRLFEDTQADTAKLIPLLEQLNEWIQNQDAWVLVEWANLLNSYDPQYHQDWHWTLTLSYADEAVRERIAVLSTGFA